MSILSKWLKVTLGVAVFALSGTAYAATPVTIDKDYAGDGVIAPDEDVTVQGETASGAAGADVAVDLSQTDSSTPGKLVIEGGDGSSDGNGGAADATLVSDVSVTDLTLTAGATSTGEGGQATLVGGGNTLTLSGTTHELESTDDAIASVTNVDLIFAGGTQELTFTKGTADIIFEANSTTVNADTSITFTNTDDIAAGFSFGNISLNGTSKLIFTDADVSSGIGNIAVVGDGNTITNNTSAALEMQAGNGLTFDLTGADFTGSGAMLTVTTGGVTGHVDGTAIALTNVDKAGYGGTVKLLNVATDGTAGFTDGGTKIKDELQVDGVAAGDATYGYKYGYTSTGAMSLRVNKVTGEAATVNVDVTADADDIVDVANLTLETGVDYTADDGAIFKAGNLNIAAGSTSVLTLVANTTTPGNVSFGEITMGDGATLDLASGVAGTNFDWTGGLTVNNTGTLSGAWALEGKDVTAIIDGGYTDGEAILALGTGATVDDATTVNLIVDATARSVEDDLSDDTALQNVLNGTTEIVTGTNATNLDGATINVESQGIGTMAGTGVLTAGGKVNAADGPIVMALQGGDDSAVYNASLSMPALMSLVNVGADTAERATGGFTPMALRGAGFSGSQFGMYASMGASSIELETGSGVDSDSFNLLIGPGLRINNGTGKTDIGAFFEAGWGSYDAFNGAFRGEGETEYYGGGLLLRHDTCFGLYGEASLRFGTATTDYNRADVDFELDSSYWGGHLGIGYIFKPSECTTLDVFAKGLMTSLDGADTEDGNGRFEIDDTDSYRTQMGAKYSYNFSQNASLYAKGAWEYEFDGETSGSYAGQRFAKNADPSGSSFIGEVGVDVRLTERVTLGGSIYGIVGQREGFGGSLSLAIGF